MISKLIGDAIEDWDVNHLPTFPILPIDGHDHSEGTFLVLDPKHMVDEIVPWLEEAYGVNANRDDIQEMIRKALSKGIWEARRDVHEDGEKGTCS